MPWDFAGVTEEDAARAKLREMRLRREGHIVGGEDAGYDVRGLSRPLDVEQQVAMKEYMKANQGEFAPKTITPSGYAEIGGKRYEMSTAPYKQYRKISDADVQKATDYAAQAKAKAEEARLAEERRKDRESDPRFQLAQLEVQKRRGDIEREAALERARAEEMKRVSGGGSWLGPVTGPQLMVSQNVPDSVASAARVGDYEGMQKARSMEAAKDMAIKERQYRYMMDTANTMAESDPAAAEAMRARANSLFGVNMPADVVDIASKAATAKLQRGVQSEQRAIMDQVMKDPDYQKAIIPRLQAAAEARKPEALMALADDIANEIVARGAEAGRKFDKNALKNMALAWIKRVAPSAETGFMANFNMSDLLPRNWGDEGAFLLSEGAPHQKRSGEAMAYNALLGR